VNVVGDPGVVMRLAAKYKLHHLETEDMMNDMERLEPSRVRVRVRVNG